MMLIADSGSTKTHWELVQNGKSTAIYTVGINPFYKNTEEIAADLRKELLPELNAPPTDIFFYGAGISQKDKVRVVTQALQKVFPGARMDVQHDLLAAARATCGSASGIACILGTGSNSCLYDGSKITDNVPSLGFTLGDEGSGGHFGRKLLQAYFYREMPDDLKKSLEAQYDMNRDHVLNSIYDTTMPNSVVASYAEFVTNNNAHPFIIKILHDGFTEFLQRHVSKYPNHNVLPLHFIGSVGFLNQKILRKAIGKMGLQCGSIFRGPMQGLVQYHTANMK